MAKVKMTWRGQALMVRVRTEARAGAQRAARLLIDEAIKLIKDTPKTGRIYGTHQASAPGEPPANLSGHLISSFRTQITQTGTVTSVSITNTAKYAGYLEFGTRKMAPRPFMRPAYVNTKEKMIAEITKAFQKAVRG